MNEKVTDHGSIDSTNPPFPWWSEDDK